MIEKYSLSFLTKSSKGFSLGGKYNVPIVANGWGVLEEVPLTTQEFHGIVRPECRSGHSGDSAWSSRIRYDTVQNKYIQPTKNHRFSVGK
mgnify:CR=1 FL=1